MTPSPVVLVAHGSRDPHSAATMRALARAVALRWPAPVATAFLDFNLPSVTPVLRGLADPSGPAPIVVPALLTQAYHGRVDVPTVLARSGVRTRLTRVLGPAAPGERPDQRLLDALRQRLVERDVEYDGVALIAAGTRDPAARCTVEAVAASLGAGLGVPCVAGYATMAPSPAAAVDAVRALGASRVVMASYSLAPGRLHSLAAAQARAAGAIAVAAPLGVATRLVDLVLSRAARL